MPWSRFLNSAASQSTMALSKLSPPGGCHRRWPSPEHAVAELQHRYVEGAAAQVEDEDGLVVLLVEAAASEAAVGSLMMRSTLRPADLAGVLGGVALGVVEVGG
jgi:hypothetical protein